MKKNLLFGLAAAALVVLNAMAFSASAKPEPQLPFEFAGCYLPIDPVEPINWGPVTR